MTSVSTRVTVAFLYSLPRIVLKSSASAIDADNAAKISRGAPKCFTAANSACFALHGNDKMFSCYTSEFAGDTPATTLTTTGAVSSVVERLVYTERVGGSKPSPPILHFRFSVGDLRLNSSRKHVSNGSFDVDPCCVEKWDAVVNRIAKN